MRQLFIDLSALAPGKGGGYQRYLENLFDGLRAVPSRPSITVLAQTDALEFVTAMVQGVAQRIDTIQAHSMAQRLWATAAYFRQTRPQDVVLFPGNVRALGCRARSVTVIHDLQYRALPQYWPWKVRVPKAALVKHSIRASHAVVAISAQTQREVQALAPDQASKVQVIDNPIVVASESELDLGQLSPQEQAWVRQLQNTRFVVTPSTLLPHKNIGALMQALAQSGLGDGAHCQFVFVGHFEPAEWPYPRPPGVQVLGYVSNALHAWLLHHAAGFVLPSVYEGFGMPYFECAARGKPCLHADLEITRDYFLPSPWVIAAPYGATQIAGVVRQFVSAVVGGTAQALEHRHNVGSYAPLHVAQRYLSLIQQVGA